MKQYDTLVQYLFFQNTQNNTELSVWSTVAWHGHNALSWSTKLLYTEPG